ncbi:MAG: hypothetical protein QOE80_3973 [Actinomycetota bacterium]|jgi:hypothetical protein|nr:hypothetical protein [Actinomycetota bacterium]
MGGRRRRERAGLRLALVLALVGSGVQAGAARAGGRTDGAGVLAATAATVAWDGEFHDVAAPSEPRLYGVAGSCERLVCDEFGVEVALPAGVWDGDPGGVQIAIEWPDEENDLDLYVYGPDGSLAGRSDGAIASTGESVRLHDTANGRYRVVVVPRVVNGPMDYRGFAEVERDPAAQPARPLLPNLVTLPVRHPHLRTGAYFADHKQDGTPSCYPEEVAEQGARRCLRFDQVIANIGDGPFELRYRMEGLATDQQLRQRIFASDGTFSEVTVDSYVFHPVHAHFHYKNFGQAFLYRPRPDGTLEKVREGRKNGFCMIDVENTRFGADPIGVPYKGEAPRTYYFPRCNTATEHDGHGTYMVNGISVGWADVYNWFLADQYIEISGVPDGVYVLETVANPARTVHETTFDDNSARVTIRLRGDSVELVQ